MSRFLYKRNIDNVFFRNLIIEVLNILADGSNVDIETLTKAGIVSAGDAKAYGVKVLGGGKIEKKLTISLPISNSAKVKIEKAGGKVI